MSEFLHPAYVIHQYPYRDSSAIVRFLTPEGGLVSAVAKGIKTARYNTKAGLLHPFTLLQISLVGKGPLYTLRQIELVKVKDLKSAKALALGLYLNELLLTFLAESESNIPLFNAYERALLGIACGDYGTALREFELSLLESLGYGFLLDGDQDEQALEPDAYYLLELEKLPLKVQETSGEDVYAGAVLLAIAQRDWKCTGARSAAKRLCKRAIQYYTGNKIFKSQLLWQQYSDME